MKTFLLSFVVFFLVSFSFAQSEDKEEIEIVQFDSEKGEWDIVIPISPDVKIARDYDPVIVINTVWELPAEFTERGIELLHPSKLFLTSEVEYSFSATFVKIEGGYLFVEESPPISMRAPKVDLLMNYHFEKDNLKTEAKYFTYVDGLYLSENESLFWLIDNDTDSIIYGEGEVIEISEVDQNEFFGEKEINNNQMRKYLTCSAIFQNQFGEVKLRSSEIKSLLLKDNDGNDFVSRNLIHKGSLTPYWNDGDFRKAHLYDMSGRLVNEFFVLSGERETVLDKIPSGMFIFKIEGFNPKKIVKIQ